MKTFADAIEEAEAGHADGLVSYLRFGPPLTREMRVNLADFLMWSIEKRHHSSLNPITQAEKYAARKVALDRDQWLKENPPWRYVPPAVTDKLVGAAIREAAKYSGVPIDKIGEDNVRILIKAGRTSKSRAVLLLRPQKSAQR